MTEAGNNINQPPTEGENKPPIADVEKANPEEIRKILEDGFDELDAAAKPTGPAGAEISEQPPGPKKAVEEALKIKKEALEEREEFTEAQRLAKLEKLERFRDPEEAVWFLATATEQQWRERKLNETYGKGLIGKFRKFLAGEYDFGIGEDGEIKRTTWNRVAEIGQRTIKSIFNRQVITGAGALGVIGILTGGFGLGAGVASLVGTAAGRGVGEAWSAINGGERKIREEIAFRQYGQWAEGRKMALEIRKSKESGAADEEVNAKIARVTEFMYQPSKDILEKQQELVETKRKHDKVKMLMGTVGGFAGLATHMGLGGLKDMLYNLDIDGDRIYHNVTMVNESMAADKWHYIHKAGAEAATKWAPLHTVTLPGGQEAHVITQHGAGWAEYLWGLGKNVARDTAVMGATYLASLKMWGAEKKEKGFGGRTVEEIAKEKEYEKRKLLKKVPPLPPPAEAAPAEAKEEMEKEEKLAPVAGVIKEKKEEPAEKVEKTKILAGKREPWKEKIEGINEGDRIEVNIIEQTDPKSRKKHFRAIFGDKRIFIKDPKNSEGKKLLENAIAKNEKIKGIYRKTLDEKGRFVDYYEFLPFFPKKYKTHRPHH